MESKTKKKLATAVAGVAMVGAAVSLTAGTFSYFTTSASTPEQSVAAGHLTIGTSVDKSINATDVAPGWHQTVNVTVKNTGTVDGQLSIVVKDRGSNTSMNNALQVCGVTPPVPCMSLADAENRTAGGLTIGTLQANQQQTYTIEVSLPETHQNQNGLQDKHASALVQATLQSVPQK